ncbi:MAG: carotenoid 1,2-hydratase [Myxococcota bacterium]|nr:carotenoid 1,2-hydratase [Myxococcota bacterium]
MSPLQLPEGPGSYRWYYLDVSSEEVTVVVIFMVGSLFSPHYSRAGRRGGHPRAHSAINVAVYRNGERKSWVLSEYPDALLEEDGGCLRIGRSTLRLAADGRLTAEVQERTAPWGKPLELRLELTPEGPGHPAIRLVEGLEHWWQPHAPRARARVWLPGESLVFEGRAYHDGNHGSVPLGSDLRGWDWLRTHDGERTTISYRPWHPRTSRSWQVEVDARSLQVSQPPLAAGPTTRTSWGLKVPCRLGLQTQVSLLESSPFYARLEAEEGGVHALGEVADFRRFHSPWFRWMAHFRTRREAAA